MENQNAVTARPNQGVRFYNPGERLSEPINYSVEGADIHTVARYVIDAEGESFFNVPTEIRFAIDGQRVQVDFPTTICQKFKDRGVVMIDEEWTPSGDDEQDDKLPFARNEKEAKEKGERIWKQYLWDIVRRWQALCNEVRAKHGIPEPAQGFTKRALKLLGMRDPALTGQDAIQMEQAVTAVAPAGESAEVAELRTQVSEMQAMLTKALGALEAKAKSDTDAQIEARATTRRNGNNRNS